MAQGNSNFTTLRAVLAEYYPADCDDAPEYMTESWKQILNEFREGSWPGLLNELDAVTDCPDSVVLDVLCAGPGWRYEDVDDARRGLQIFLTYLETYE